MGGSPLPAGAPAAVPVATADGAPTPPTSARVIVEDGVDSLGPGQMRRGEFLSRLRTAVEVALDEALAPVGRSTSDCPYIEHWFAFYGTQASEHVERTARRYAPETALVATAVEYLHLISERAQRAAVVWARTGRITGVPDGLNTVLSGMRVPAVTSLPLLRKAEPGHAASHHEAETVRARLGDGRALEDTVRSRMGSAFGADFSAVRLHTDASADQASHAVGAQAFTVGHHVAFAAGRYQPGTLVGDALIAHELAHVLQQREASTTQAEASPAVGAAHLEYDADLAATGTVLSLWGAAQGGTAGIPPAGKPALRSGLRISRCKDEAPAALPKKSVTINPTNLHGATNTITSPLEFANKKVYHQANVEVKKGHEETLDETKSKAILGEDLSLDAFPSPDKPTDEEKALFKVNQSSGALTMYFVKEFNPTGRTGEAFWPALGHGFNGFVVGNPGIDQTFSHELGHVLLDDGGHNVPDDTYLMHPVVGASKTKLTPEQITKIRSSPFVT